MISCACLAGIVLYAFYSKCDPIKRQVISQPDQVSQSSFVLIQVFIHSLLWHPLSQISLCLTL